jgi:hypothetical protein
MSRRRVSPQRLVERLESRALLAVVVPSLSGTEGFPLDGQVATFLSGDVKGSSAQAAINWGDGHTTPGTVVPVGTNFAVDGLNTYAVPGTYTVTVIMTGTDNSSAIGNGPATIGAIKPFATGTTITPTAGQAFTGVVASFTDAYPALTPLSYRATIAWGDGHISIGTITPVGTAFDVSGTNTYAAAGSDTISVTIIRIIDNQMAVATSDAVAVAPSLAASGTTITAVAGQAFTGTVASFSDTNPQPAPAGYSASIAWGDGQSSGGIVTANAQGSFDVIGTHVYGAPKSSESLVVTITRLSDGQTVIANSSAIVVNASSTVTGQLDPLSDTGVSNADGITAINQPSFNGTAMPFAIVQFFARRADQAQPVLLGQAVANSNGAWTIAVGALPDGVYSFTVAQIPPTGLPTSMVAVTPNPIVIDTAPPSVLAVTSQPRSNQIVITFKDSLSGLDLTEASNPANYALIGPHGFRIHPASVTIVPSATVAASDPITATLKFNKSMAFRSVAAIALGGITDLAGNRLPREYFRLPAPRDGHADALQSSHIAARLRHRHHL